MNGDLRRPAAEFLVKTLQALSKAQALYPEGHAAVNRAGEALDAALGAAFAECASLLIGLTDGYLVVGGCAFVDGNKHAQDLAARLESREVEGVVLQPGTTSADAGRFLEWLRAPSAALWRDPKITLTTLDRSAAHWKRAVRLHGAAVQALQEADRDIREGRLPNPGKAKECVSAFSELIEEKPAILPGLLLIKDYDNYTFYHSVNVSLLSIGIGRQLGFSTEELEHLGVGGLMHDIGKTRTPVDVIRKPGKLSADEFDLIRWHPVHGRDILTEMGELPEAAIRIVYEHHRGFDGSGYPSLSGTAGPAHRLTALVTTADIYDAMTTHRPYQGPLAPPAAVAEMQGMRGAHLNPEVFDAFVALLGTIPVGTLLRLRTGEVAVATLVEKDGPVAEVLVVAGKDGRDLAESERETRKVSPEDVAGWVGSLSRRLDVFEAVKSQI